MEKINDILIGIIPVAICYLCGGLYLFFYLNNFGIYLFETNLTIQHIFFNSFFVFYSKSFIIFLVVAIFAAIFIHTYIVDHFEKIYKLYFYLLAVIFLSISIATVAKVVAGGHADEVWSGRGASQELVIAGNGNDITAYAQFVNGCKQRPSYVIFADTKHRYILCRSISRPNFVGRIFRINTDGDITGTWKLKR